MPPFKRARVTWIKPSFRWMMYRCGWATKPGQERVLAVEITRTGFEWALARACLSHYDPNLHGDHGAWSRQLAVSPVRVQWDPERSARLGALLYRSLQLGLSSAAALGLARGDGRADPPPPGARRERPTVLTTVDSGESPLIAALSGTSDRARCG